MSNYPILFFPDPIKPGARSHRPTFPGKIHRPDISRQKERIGPQFEVLENAISNGSFHIQESADGADSEKVLVLKIIGSIEEFISAVRRIEGFEWFNEIDVPDITPDEDYYKINSNGERSSSSLSGRLFLISSNSQALSQLLSLWTLYKDNPLRKFNRGQAKFKELFAQLHEIRFWNAEDRFDGINLVEEWLQGIELNPTLPVKFQIELWYHRNQERQAKALSNVHSLLIENGGTVLTSCKIEEIQYHGILAEVPASNMRNIINNIDTNTLVHCDDIMYFRPAGQILRGESRHEDARPINIHQGPLPSGSPVIAILDGHPMAKHAVLDGRLSIEDPDSYMQQYTGADQWVHGTEMCSAIVKGDMESNEPYISSPLYVRPIMYPNKRDIYNRETIPDDVLIVDLIHRAIVRMFEGENGNAPTAPDVKIINLSIGDPAHSFYCTISPLARLIDWLSYKYKVLFVISAGNASAPIMTGISESQLKQLSDGEREKLFFDYLISKRTYNKILSPAESINSITVGSTHEDDAVPNGYLCNPFVHQLPSTYTPFGGGFRKSIKPDLVFPGGRLQYVYNPTVQFPIKPSENKTAPGIKVAYPSSNPNHVVYDRGTSFSTALISRNLYFCYEELNSLLTSNPIDDDYIAIILKAMAIHGCSWDEIGNNIDALFTSAKDADEKKLLKTQWIGYGIPNFAKSRYCNPQCATIIGIGSLKQETADIYRLPLPPSLASRTTERRLTITLSWFTPITAGSQKYRTAKLWFDAKNSLANKRETPDYRRVQNGTIQHEIFTGDHAAAFIDGDAINIQVNCAKDASVCPEEIKYAIMVSLEVKQETGLPIYEEVRSRISVPIEVQL